LTGSIIDADATLFEVGRRLKYLSQARRRNCHRKGRKMSTPSLEKGWRATARRERGQQGKAHRQQCSKRKKLTGAGDDLVVYYKSKARAKESI